MKCIINKIILVGKSNQLLLLLLLLVLVLVLLLLLLLLATIKITTTIIIGLWRHSQDKIATLQHSGLPGHLVGSTRCRVLTENQSSELDDDCLTVSSKTTTPTIIGMYRVQLFPGYRVPSIKTVFYRVRVPSTGYVTN